MLREDDGAPVASEVREGTRFVGPEVPEPLRDERLEAIRASGARVVTSAVPALTMQLLARLRAARLDVKVVRPMQLLERVYAGADR